jgi:hypothetical protein
MPSAMSLGRDNRIARRYCKGYPVLHPAPSWPQELPLVCLLRVCAVERRRFPVGARPTRQSLQPEATGAAMKVTK